MFEKGRKHIHIGFKQVNKMRQIQTWLHLLTVLRLF